MSAVQGFVKSSAEWLGLSELSVISWVSIKWGSTLNLFTRFLSYAKNSNHFILFAV